MRCGGKNSISSLKFGHPLILSLSLKSRSSLNLSQALCFLQAMEPNNTTDEHQYSSPQHSTGFPTQAHRDNGASHPSSYVFIIIIAVTSFILLIVLSLIIILLRRLKSSKKSSKADCNGNSIKRSSGDFTTSLRPPNYHASPGKI